MAMFRRALTEIEALDRELYRLHRALEMVDSQTNSDSMLSSIQKIEDLLMTIAKKNNGMEW